MPEARAPHEASRESAFGCEDDAREALASASGSAVVAGPATLSLRWRRSGAEGFLVTTVVPGRPAQDADGVRWLALAGEAVAADQDTDSDNHAMRLHRALYRHRADVSAVSSARPVFSTTLACLPPLQAEGIPEFHPDVTAAAGGAIRCAAQAPSGSAKGADPVLDALRDRHACLLRGRGLLAVGHTLAAVLARTAEIESLAQIYWQVLQLTGKAAGSPIGTTPAGTADDSTARVAEAKGR